MQLVNNLIKFHVYNNLKTISDLSERIIDVTKIPRDKIKICVIDDEGFNLKSLNSLGFKDITVHDEFCDIADYEKYNIILCDVDGVGREIDYQQQGIAVSSQLKRHYPNKLIYVYTGKTLTNYGELAEGVSLIKKPVSANDLSTRLLSDFEDSLKTRNVWNNNVKRLIEEGTSNKTIAFLEDIFVRSIIDRDNYFTKDNLKFRSKHAFEVRTEVLTLISSGIQTILMFKGMLGL